MVTKRISDVELEKLLYKSAKKQNPFDITVIAMALELPKYCYARNVKEKIGLSPAQIGTFISKHPDFEKCNNTNKFGANWVCHSLKKQNENGIEPMSDDELLNVLREVGMDFNPFDFCDICLHFGVSRTSKGIEELKNKYGITPARVGLIVSKHKDEFGRFTKGESSPNRMKWSYYGNNL